jgi:serine/threonine protein phosphatase PrpC
MPFETALASRQGDRRLNQDRGAARIRESAGLLLLADGLGGHPRGELAAQVFIDSLSAAFAQARGPIPDPGRFLERAMSRAHAEIVRAGEQEHPPVAPLTTAVACLVQQQRACWTHVGDSRLYLFRGGHRFLQTRDHSLVQEAIELGEWPEEARELHPLRNAVTRTLGGRSQAPVIEHPQEIDLQPGDTLLLCSDGLWSALPESRLLQLAAAPDLGEAVQEIARQAEQAGRPHSDNVTLVVLRMA